jgi:hypothetical protein
MVESVFLLSDERSQTAALIVLDKEYVRADGAGTPAGCTGQCAPRRRRSKTR